MDEQETREVFGGFNPADYDDEVRERWGDTDAYKESARRTARYTKTDWERFEAESQQIGTDTARLMDEGASADDPRVMDLAEQARLQIDRWFYPCTHEMHANLAEMYIADPRFTATYEKIREGMARYWHDAILANAARQQ
ncbi:MAG: TipAS antibiotic-recognition domain-containing protein [Coriobacteriia bacterium]|nr:TipAS antibiotic-recognition domain-containing protein [Coriobacteriia bacterium]